MLHRKADLCQAIERELMSVLGIDHYKTNSLTCTVLVDYDPQAAQPGARSIEILDSALASAEHPTAHDKLDLHLPLCTASLPLAATAQFAAPGAPAGGGGAVRLHVDPHVQGGPRGPVRGEAAGRRRARRDRGRRLPGHDVDLPRAPCSAGA